MYKRKLDIINTYPALFIEPQKVSFNTWQNSWPPPAIFENKCLPRNISSRLATWCSVSLLMKR